MIDNNAQYSGLANIMNMRDRNPNTQLAYVPNGYLNSVPTAPNPYTGIPQVNSPIAMNEGGMPSQQYPMQEEASELADRGRYGDTTLVHMTPGEVQGLASLGQLTINPDTGLPEAFSLGSVLPIIANVGLAVATGGMSLPAQMAIMGAANFGMGLMQGQSTEQALMGGLTSAATTGIFSGLSSTLSGAAGKAGTEAATKTAAQAAAAQGATSAAAEQAAQASLLGGFDDIASSYAGSGLMTNATGTPLVANIANAFDPTSLSGLDASAIGFDPNLVINTGTGPSFGAELANVAGIPDAVNAGITPAQAGVEGFGVDNAFFTPEGYSGVKLDQAIEPNLFQRNILGETTSYAKGDIVPFSEFKGKGIFGGDIAYQDMGLEERLSANISNPSSYAPIVTGALSGAFNDVPDPVKQEERIPPETAFNTFDFKRGARKTPLTEKEALEIALRGGRQTLFEPSRFIERTASQGGLIGLANGGPPTAAAPPIQQQPSAVQAMLSQSKAQPVPVVQPIMMQQPQMQQPQMQQPMSMPGVGQAQPQGIEPFADPMKQFMSTLDMDETKRRQDGQQALSSMIGGAGNYLQSQGINYPTTTPSGTIPKPIAPNQGSQVNLGASGGFAQGGLLGYNEGGMPSQDQRYFEGQVVGKGDGQSDEVPFNVDGGEVDMAMLSPDEYVLAADVVSYIGDGSSNAGAAKLDQFMEDVREQAHGSDKQINGFDERGLANLVA
jgi:hypothetical protein